MCIDALDQRMFEPLFDLPAAPFGLGLFLRYVGSAIFLGKRYQPLGRIGITVEDDVFASNAQFWIDIVVDVELPRIDDRHVQPRRNGMIQEDRMHRPPNGLVAAKREGEVREPARIMGVRAQNAQFLKCLDEIDAVIIMLFNSRRDRKNIGIENDVLRRKADAGEQVVSALADFDLALFGIGLPGLVERHHDDCRTISHTQPRVMQECFFAFLHRDRVHDWFARNAFQTSLDHAPFGAIDHQRYTRDVRFGRNALDEGRHRLMRVEQPFIHVNVDNLRAIFNLIARDLDSGFIVAC
jgi:hypothetical protein